MTKPKIRVTGATGKTGAAVVAQLREKDYPVRALVHLQIAITSHYAEGVRRGAFEYGSPSDDVLAVAGTDAEDFETTVRRYASSPGVQRNLGIQVRAVLDFVRLLLTRPYDLDGYVAEQGQPRPPPPELAMDSKTWRREHAPWEKGGASAAMPVALVGAGATVRRTSQPVVAS